MVKVRCLLNSRNFIFLAVLSAYSDNLGTSEKEKTPIFTFENPTGFVGKNNNIFHFCFYGNSGVGKTSIVREIQNDVFPNYITPTVEIDCYNIYYKIDKEIEIIFKIFDFCGANKFENKLQHNFKNKEIFFLFYDITDKSSFEGLKEKFQYIKTQVDANTEFVLVGNKIDLNEQRKVSKEEGEEFAQNNNMFFLEVSAKDSTGIFCEPKHFLPKEEQKTLEGIFLQFAINRITKKNDKGKKNEENGKKDTENNCLYAWCENCCKNFCK